MIRTLLECLEITNKLINSYEFLIANRLEAKYFSKKGKLGFVNTIMFLLNFVKKSLQLELNKFQKLLGGEDISVTKQAFSKARQHIKPEAFKSLFRVTTDTAMKNQEFKTYKGYKIYGIDGTTLQLENTLELSKSFGTLSSEGACRARASILCELLNGVVIDAEIENIHIGERVLAARHLDYFRQFSQSNDLLIADRGYASKDLIEDMFLNNNKFLMRLQKSFNKEIDQSTDTDFYVWQKCGKNSYRVRVIKLVLPDGETETLITNLAPEEFEHSEFQELYFLRWPIETKYDVIKNKLLIENFTGKTKVAILQDFYATMYLANIVAFAKSETDEKIASCDENKDLKHSYKTNENMLIGELKDELILAVIQPDPILRQTMIDKVLQRAIRYKIPIRPGRHFDRPPDSRQRKKRKPKTVL